MPCALDQHRTSALGVSKDSFYVETHPNTMPIEHELLETWRAWERGGVMATDMECAAIFIVAAARHLRASGILLCVNEPPYSVKPSALDGIAVAKLIDAAIASLRMLIAANEASARK
jgi:uridine phosphorylase